MTVAASQFPIAHRCRLASCACRTSQGVGWLDMFLTALAAPCGVVTRRRNRGGGGSGASSGAGSSARHVVDLTCPRTCAGGWRLLCWMGSSPPAGGYEPLSTDRILYHVSARVTNSRVCVVLCVWGCVGTCESLVVFAAPIRRERAFTIQTSITVQTSLLNPPVITAAQRSDQFLARWQPQQDCRRLCRWQRSHREFRSCRAAWSCVHDGVLRVRRWIQWALLYQMVLMNT